jgi:glucose dehydrogenase
MAITTDGRRVFVGERSWDRTLSRTHSAIRAYEQRTGAVLWQDRLAPSDGQVGLWQVAVAGSRVFVSGEVSSPVVDEGSLLRAYDVDTGHLLWETVRSVAGDISTYAASSLAAWQNRVVTAGAVYNAAWDDSDLLVGTYDATTGRLLWEDRVDVGNTDEAMAVDASSSGVFVTGWVGSSMSVDGPSPSPIDTDFFVRAYDVQSGHVRWTDRVDSGFLDGGLAIATLGDRVFAAGVVDTPLGDSDYNRDVFVRAYEAR